MCTFQIPFDVLNVNVMVILSGVAKGQRLARNAVKRVMLVQIVRG
jgi:hypothetical protein